MRERGPMKDGLPRILGRGNWRGGNLVSLIARNSLRAWLSTSYDQKPLGLHLPAESGLIWRSAVWRRGTSACAARSRAPNRAPALPGGRHLGLGNGRGGMILAIEDKWPAIILARLDQAQLLAAARAMLDLHNSNHRFDGSISLGEHAFPLPDTGSADVPANSFIHRLPCCGAKRA